jgi:hypothetical protein
MRRCRVHSSRDGKRVVDQSTAHTGVGEVRYRTRQLARREDAGSNPAPSSMDTELTKKEIDTGRQLFCDLKRSRAAFDAHCYEVYRRTRRPHRDIADAFGCDHRTVGRAIERERERRGEDLGQQSPNLPSEARKPGTQQANLNRQASKREQRKAEKTSSKQNKRINDRLREITKSARALNDKLDKAMELVKGDPDLIEGCLDEISALVKTFEAISSYIIRNKEQNNE